ncbi:MAG: hypothetical protein P8X46_01370 [Nitrospirales bacterium]
MKDHPQQVTRRVENIEKAFGCFNGPTRNRLSLADRLRSGYHRFWYEASQALAWSRGMVREAAVGTLHDLTPLQRTRIEELARVYGTPFEVGYQHVCDLGSANFAYASALHAFFQPAQLVGVEVDGHRLYCNGRSRIDYALGHIQDLPHTEYVTADYRHYIRPADIITAWYPFVTPKPLLAWRLPLSLFDPGALFAQVANNLIIGGLFIMINHSPDEAEVARGIAEDVGLVCTGQYVHETPLRARAEYSVLTLWHHG